MSTIVTRSGKGSPLTHNEVDTNFTNLNTDKVEKTAADITGGTINNTTIGATTPSTGVFTTLTAQTEVLKGTGQNLFLYSQPLNIGWNKQGTATLTDNSTTAPDGTATAALLASPVGSDYIYQVPTTILGVSYTFSYYVKNSTATESLAQVRTSSTAIQIKLTWSSGVPTPSVTVGSGSVTATSVGSGWYRIAIVYVAVEASARHRIYGGDGTSVAGNVFIWGVQLELGSTANTYIPTTTTAVYGTPTLSFSGVASIGLQSDGSLYETSAGTGNVRFYTNNIGQEQARVSHTASAVNYHQLTGSATGSGPIHSVAGSDTNIDLNLTTKGTGAVNLRTNTGTQLKVVDATGTTVDNPWLVRGGQTFVSKSVLTSYAPKIQASDASAITFNTNAGSSGIEGGQQQFAISHTASAVNYVQVTGAATGGRPTISAQGSDASAGLNIYGKAGGSMIFSCNGGSVIALLLSNTTSGVNYYQMAAGVTGTGPVLSAQGSDTNIPLVVQPKGTGALQAQQTDSTATGGNARGANAVDWQTSRSTAAQVGSGSGSVVGGGAQNIASATYTTVAGGVLNSATAFASFIGAGQSNTSSGGRSAVVTGRGNTAAGELNFIGGGYTNSGTALAAVTTQSGTMNGTTAVTLSGSNANIKVGQFISGTSIASETYVAAISGTSLTLSQNASGSSTSTLSFYTPHGVVVGGGNNQATGSYSAILGGGDAGTAANRNVASGDWSFVGGGAKNVASGLGAVVVGGGVYATSTGPTGNTASNIGAGVVSGFTNTSSGYVSFIGAGQTNTASGSFSSVVGGYANTANADLSFIGGGAFGTTRSITGLQAMAACNQPIGSSLGISQAALLILGAQTTDATATVLRSNTSAASTVNQVILPNNSAYTFRGEIVSGVTGGGNSKSWTIEGLIKRGANAAATTLVGSTVTSLYADAGATTWAIALSADTTNGGLAVTFTGQAATTIRTVCQIRTTEMTY